MLIVKTLQFNFSFLERTFTEKGVLFFLQSSNNDSLFYLLSLCLALFYGYKYKCKYKFKYCSPTGPLFSAARLDSVEYFQFIENKSTDKTPSTFLCTSMLFLTSVDSTGICCPLVFSFEKQPLTLNFSMKPKTI